jgi:hypothetical protein
MRLVYRVESPDQTHPIRLKRIASGGWFSALEETARRVVADFHIVLFVSPVARSANGGYDGLALTGTAMAALNPDAPEELFLGELFAAIPPMERPNRRFVVLRMSEAVADTSTYEVRLARKLSSLMAASAGFLAETRRGHLLCLVSYMRLGLPVWEALKQLVPEARVSVPDNSKAKVIDLDVDPQWGYATQVLSGHAFVGFEGLTLAGCAHALSQWPRYIPRRFLDAYLGVSAARLCKMEGTKLPFKSRLRMILYQWRYRQILRQLFGTNGHAASTRGWAVLNDAELTSRVLAGRMIKRAARPPVQ